MALILPHNFENDIQGRDTALVPVVVIGTFLGDYSDATHREWFNSAIHISTNKVSYNDRLGAGSITMNTLPILLNIPSLKESIDIEKRNYKISSVNIDISNFPYEGQRFSDLIADSSLINKECRIFWLSPSTSSVFPMDKQPDYVNEVYGFQIYNGKIRRYTHDDEKVRLVVEDRSQATLHKDLPLEENYLGTGDEVPDKYKNKPIPMVYGHVDRSPLVLHSPQGSTILQADSGNISNINYTTSHNIFGDTLTSLTIAINDKYVHVKEDQYIVENNNIKLLATDLNGDDTLLLEEKLNCIIYHKPLEIRLISGMSTGNTTNHIESLNNINDFIDNDLDTFQTFPISNTYDGYIINYLVEVFLQINLLPRIDYDDIIKQTPAINGIIITHGEGDWKVYQSNSADDDSATNTEIDGDGYSTLFGFGVDSSADIVSISSYYGDDDIAKQIQFNISSSHSTFAYQAISLVDTSFIDGYTSSHSVKIRELDIKTELVIGKIFTNNFYANVNGRVMTNGDSPTAPAIIADILNTELGQNVTAETGVSNLQYAFTVDKKINSKKLIEEIASSSPYIPRFNNMGEFKFTEIPKTYFDSPTPIQIKEAHIIDFSYSRTKIEDVATKVIVNYKYDYARDEFQNKSTVLITHDIDNPPDGIEGDDWYWYEYFYGKYDYDYYGLKLDDSESTLIVDSKYIRDRDTALEYCSWLLLFNMNQHLKIKVKLPLKYMDIEIGDIVQYDKVINDVKPYGIDYGKCSIYESDDTRAGNGAGYGNIGHSLNGQQLFPSFIVTSTNKTLEWVEVECMQSHNLSSIEDEVNVQANLCPDEVIEEEEGICLGVNPETNELCAYFTTEDACNEADVSGPDDCYWETDCPEGYDICGVCGGDTTNPNDCDECPPDFELDCFDECGGSAVVDECFECGGNCSPIDGITEGCHECWDGSLVCVGSEDECPEGVVLGRCRNDGIYVMDENGDTLYMEEEECLNSTIMLTDPRFIPNNTVHINPDGTIIYNISHTGQAMYRVFLEIKKHPGDAKSAVRVLGRGIEKPGGGPYVTDHFDDRIYGCFDADGNLLAEPGGCFPEEGAQDSWCSPFTDADGCDAMGDNCYWVEPTPGCDPDCANDDSCNNIIDLKLADCPSAEGYNVYMYGIRRSGWLTSVHTDTLEDGGDLTVGITAKFYSINNSCTEETSHPTAYGIYPQIAWTPVFQSGSGDLNLDGRTDIADMVLMGNHLSGDSELNNNQLVIADVLRNNNVSILDIVNLANMIVGGAYG